jgi:DNA ligase (NAD+)
VQPALRPQGRAGARGHPRLGHRGRGHHRQRPRHQGDPQPPQDHRRARDPRRALHEAQRVRPLQGRLLQPAKPRRRIDQAEGPQQEPRAHLSFFPYDVIGPDFTDEREKFALLKTLGFAEIDHEFVPREQLQAAYERFARARPNLDYEIDGVVYRTASVKEQNRLGLTGHHPRYAIAYKFQGDSGHTGLLDVLWSVSRTGVITPVAILEPVELSGAMIGRASLHNLNIFEALGLTQDCRVEVTRRGGVIPNVERVIEAGPHAKPFALPTHCPACASPVERKKKREGEFLFCSKPKQCVQARLGELEHFAKASTSRASAPRSSPRPSTPACSRPRPTTTSCAPRTSPSSSAWVRRARRTSSTRSSRTASCRWRCSCRRSAPPHLGKQNATLLAGEFLTLERIRSLTRDDLMEIKGIKDAIADAIVDGIATRCRAHRRPPAPRRPRAQGREAPRSPAGR